MVAGITYYLQVGSAHDQGGLLHFYLEVAPQPQAEFWFDPGDPSVGKVTFKAAAYIMGARDALFADNEAISMPTEVSR